MTHAAEDRLRGAGAGARGQEPLRQGFELTAPVVAVTRIPFAGLVTLVTRHDVTPAQDALILRRRCVERRQRMRQIDESPAVAHQVMRDEHVPVFRLTQFEKQRFEQLRIFEWHPCFEQASDFLPGSFGRRGLIRQIDDGQPERALVFAHDALMGATLRRDDANSERIVRTNQQRVRVLHSDRVHRAQLYIAADVVDRRARVTDLIEIDVTLSQRQREFRGDGGAHCQEINVTSKPIVDRYPLLVLSIAVMGVTSCQSSVPRSAWKMPCPACSSTCSSFVRLSLP